MEGLKNNCQKAVRLTALGGEGGSPPLSLTTSICENFDPFLSFIKRQNNPKYGNLSRNFHIFLTASGEGRGGSTQAVSLTAFSQFFFLNPSLKKWLNISFPECFADRLSSPNMKPDSVKTRDGNPCKAIPSVTWNHGSNKESVIS